MVKFYGICLRNPKSMQWILAMKLRFFILIFNFISRYQRKSVNCHKHRSLIRPRPSFNKMCCCYLWMQFTNSLSRIVVVVRERYHYIQTSAVSFSHRLPPYINCLGSHTKTVSNYFYWSYKIRSTTKEVELTIKLLLADQNLFVNKNIL